MSYILRGEKLPVSVYDSRPLVLPDMGDCASVLPLAAVIALRKAVATDPGVPASYSRNRVVALGHAIERVKFMYPNFFNHQ